MGDLSSQIKNIAISFSIKLFPSSLSFKYFILSMKNTPGLYGLFFFYD